MSHRRIVERVRDALRLLLRVHMRHDDAEGAIVQQPRRFIERAGAHAHESRNAGAQAGDADLRRLLHGERAVLHVHRHIVMPRGSRQHRCGAGAQMMQPEAQRDIALAQLPLRDVVHDRHDRPPQPFARLPFRGGSTAAGGSAPKKPLRALAPIRM